MNLKTFSDISFFLYILSILGIFIVPTHFIRFINLAIQLYISIFFIIFFNPFFTFKINIDNVRYTIFYSGWILFSYSFFYFYSIYDSI